jgi:hypothetical protein
MQRRDFVPALAMVPAAGIAMKPGELNDLIPSFGSTDRIPVLPVAHGSRIPVMGSQP